MKVSTVTTMLALLAVAALLLAALVGFGLQEKASPAIDSAANSRLARAAEALIPLHKKKTPGSWMGGPGRGERRQSFEGYVRANPPRSTAARTTLYLVLLGEFDAERRKVVDLCAEYMSIYFGLPVKFAEPLSLTLVPDTARRIHPSWGMPQIHAGYVLNDLLKPRVPDDAVALIAFTASDLYPREDWNFVFGMASLRERVGVWSIYRYGDPAAGAAEFTFCLKRTIKVGTHETGHMLGILHCVAYECNMNGSNSLPESDASPLALCPECARKLWWACGCDPVERFRRLEEFCRQHGMPGEANFFRASREKIEPVFGKAATQE